MSQALGINPENARIPGRHAACNAPRRNKKEHELMKLFRLLVTASFLAIVPAAGIGCNSEDITDIGEEKTLSDLEVGPGIDTLAKGSTIKFKVTATYADGSTEDVSNHADTVWNTSDAENATVDEDGLVTATDEGTVTISVTFQRMTAEEDFLVTP
ncbi:MAG TPA: Ig-like domain-containing protein [Polyangiaceae bacterium]|jgi:hypothetical protein|nr:Ig-like domain-containing protein [Polyangiaceae bacterium]